VGGYKSCTQKKYGSLNCGLIRLRIGISDGLLWTQGWEFPGYLVDYQLHKKVSVAWSLLYKYMNILNWDLVYNNFLRLNENKKLAHPASMDGNWTWICESRRDICSKARDVKRVLICSSLWISTGKTKHEVVRVRNLMREVKCYLQWSWPVYILMSYLEWRRFVRVLQTAEV
jgi:hypothetical protein